MTQREMPKTNPPAPPFFKGGTNFFLAPMLRMGTMILTLCVKAIGYFLDLWTRNVGWAFPGRARERDGKSL